MRIPILMPESPDRSRHAASRSQQRGVSQDVIDAVLSYRAVVDHGGSKKYYMDRKARELAKRELGSRAYRRIADRLNTYLVVDGGTIVTVAKMRKRIKSSKPDRPIKPRRRPIR